MWAFQLKWEVPGKAGWVDQPISDRRRVESHCLMPELELSDTFNTCLEKSSDTLFTSWDAIFAAVSSRDLSGIMDVWVYIPRLEALWGQGLYFISLPSSQGPSRRPAHSMCSGKACSMCRSFPTTERQNIPSIDLILGSSNAIPHFSHPLLLFPFSVNADSQMAACFLIMVLSSRREHVPRTQFFTCFPFLTSSCDSLWSPTTSPFAFLECFYWRIMST